MDARSATGKTHTTAAVLIPPDAVRGPIQAIRRRHDRQFRRWMPHITLLYPFRPREQFDALADAFAPVARAVDPFEIGLAEFRSFAHPAGSFTLWLAPEPPGPVVRLHEGLWRVTPDCDEVRRHDGGFTPHLSVGQACDRQAESELRRELQAAWRPLSFVCTEVSLIYRRERPDDVFRVGVTVPLGGDPSVSAPNGRSFDAG